MKKIITLLVSLLPLSSYALGLINDFEWLEPNNRVEIVVGEPYQLKFNCSDNSLPFTSDYADSWVHYDFDGGQHVVSSPTGYSIDNKGVITGLVAGSYAIKFPCCAVENLRKIGAKVWIHSAKDAYSLIILPCYGNCSQCGTTLTRPRHSPSLLSLRHQKIVFLFHGIAGVV